MLTSIKLQANISCEYICTILQKAIVEYQKDNDVSDSLLVIDIRKINDDTSLIPKIEYKNLDS